jgi:predicted trehalose synthase
MVQNGYAFFSAKEQCLEKYMKLAKLASQNGSGDVRINDENNSSQTGIDIFSDSSIIRRLYPNVNPQVEVAMRVRRAGYLNVPKLGTVFPIDHRKLLI